MAYATALREDARRQLEEIGRADIVVGIPSYNNAGTIAHVVRMAAEGMVKHFPDLKPVLINSDGGSTDGTTDVVRRTPVPDGVQVIATVYQGVPGKGSAFRAIFEAARRLGAQACVVVDSDLRSITPEWIELLAGPVIRQGFGYVTPFYARHKYDGTITNNICYPMTRMLYGVDVRQPIGGDFGFSGSLLDVYLGQDVWETDVARFGIDIWMTTTAINQDVRVCQAHLGAKIHDPKDPAAALGPMFRQVVGTLLGMMATYERRWQAVDRVQPTAMYGQPKDIEPEPVSVTLPTMIERFRSGVAEHADILRQALLPDTWRRVEEAARRSPEAFDFPAELWVDVLFDCAVAFNKRGLDRTALLDAMTPLYYGRTAGTVVVGADMDTATFEREVVQTQAELFMQAKPELIRRWRSV
ncbi:MAG: glycosyltransferase [Chloroflexi bacterium]|nr:glycosyltransferase [Chloroflexota bacterium]